MPPKSHLTTGKVDYGFLMPSKRFNRPYFALNCQPTQAVVIAILNNVFEEQVAYLNFEAQNLLELISVEKSSDSK